MSDPSARGWGPGWPSCQTSLMVPQRHITGRVHRDIHELVTILCDETVRRGYQIRRDWSWGFACRPIGNTSRPSYHSWGLAVDLNAPTNPMRSPLTTDMPSWLPELWEAYGFGWGGRWTRTPDPMHFQHEGTPADAERATARARADLTGTAPPAPPEEDVMAHLSDEAQRFYQQQYESLMANDARPTSLSWLLVGYRKARERFEKVAPGLFPRPKDP